MKEYITKNFQWEEFEISDRAAELEIDNTIPDDTVAENIRALVFEILQPLRDASVKGKLWLPLQSSE